MSPADSPFAQLPAPGPHPAPAELRAYAAGTLPPAEEHRIEAHTLDCERCADLVEGFSMTDAATTDKAVAELRTRLQARIGDAQPEPVVTGGWAWPRLAAAAALLAVVGGGIWGWEQQHQASNSPSVARHETASATAPAASSAPQPQPAPPPASPVEAEVAASPEVAQDAAKASAKLADYAAVMPKTRRSTRESVARSVVPDRQPTDDAADRTTLDEMKVPAGSSAPQAVVAQELNSTPAASSPEPSNPADVAYNSPSPKAPKRSASVLSGHTYAAETTASPQKPVVVASQLSKSKAMAASAPAAPSDAPAMVPATPMPAAPAINPAPVVGTIAFREYLRREATSFDPEINNLRLSGTVRLKFVVGADGKINNLRVTRGLRPDYDAEALRIVCDGPAWQPGIAGGKRAALSMEVTVPF